MSILKFPGNLRYSQVMRTFTILITLTVITLNADQCINLQADKLYTKMYITPEKHKKYVCTEHCACKKN